jgi:hypothetical protein
MINYSWNNFPTLGFLLGELTDEQVKPIWEEVRGIQENFDTARKHNKNLAGHIKKEYTLDTSKKYLEELLSPLMYEYDLHYNYYKSINILSEKRHWGLGGAWVNFMEKHEFNPIHEHGGIMSFVIWLKVPYEIQDEIDNYPDVLGNTAGKFNFHFVNPLGTVDTYPLPVDKSWENKLALFPARMLHSVNPFYTSDDYRISVSGNFELKV